MTPTASLLIVVREFPPMVGGIGRLMRDLALFAQRAVKTSVLFIGSEECERDNSGIRISFLPAVPSAHQFMVFLKQKGVTHVLFSHVNCVGLWSALACRLVGVEAWCYVHGADVGIRFGGVYGIRKRTETRIKLWTMTGIFVNSSRTAALIKKELPRARSHVIHPGIWPTEQLFRRRAIASEQKALRIVAVGRLIKRKGFDTLLNALRLLEGDAVLTIIGDGPERHSLEAQVADLNLGARVQILSGLDDQAVQEELHSHDVFCLLPRELSNGDIEGFGIVFLEAAVAGLPVVAGNSGGVTDAVNDGENGYLVDPHDYGMAASRLRLLLADEHLRRQMGNASLEWAKRFRWDLRSAQEELCFLRDGGKSEIY